MTSGGKKAKVFPRQSTLSHDHPLAKQFPVSDDASDPAIVAQNTSQKSLGVYQTHCCGEKVKYVYVVVCDKTR